MAGMGHAAPALLLVEQADLILVGRLGLAAALERAADYPQHLDRPQAHPRHENALRIAEWIGRDHGETMVLQLEEVVGQNPLHHLAVAKLQADPKARHFRTSVENQAFGGRSLFKFADKSNELHFRVGHYRKIALGGEQFHALGLKKRSGIDISG